MRTIAAVIAFDEEKKIGSVLDRFVPGLVDEVVVVDDGSSDATASVSRSKGATVLPHDRRRGVGAAIRTAINYARGRWYDVLVVLAGNDKDRPSEIPRLVRPIEEDMCHFVQGSRYLKGGEHGGMPLYRRVATRAIHPVLFSMAVRRRITDSTNGFRALKLVLFDDERMAIDQPWLDKYELEPYLFFKAIRLGYKVVEVPVTKIYPPSELGYTKMTVAGWWSILRPVIYLGLGIKR